MRRISLYLAGIIIFGIFITGFWIYGKYFERPASDVITLVAARGDMRDIINARGEVVSQKEFDLAFPFSGIVEKVYVKKDDRVHQGDALMKLETKELDLELSRLAAIHAQSKANLDKLRAGATLEDTNVSRVNVESARAAQTSAEENLLATIIDAHTRADDAVRNKIDPLFTNPRTDPKLSFSTNNAQAKIDIETLRLSTESALHQLSSTLTSSSVKPDLLAETGMARDELALVRTLCDKATIVLSDLTSTANISQTTIDTWRANISTGRLNVGIAMSALALAEEKLSAARSNLSIAEHQLSLKQAGTRLEEVAMAEAQVEEINSEIATITDRRNKATLYAPADATVTAVHRERKEIFVPGTSAISLSIAAVKIESDISELDIGRIAAKETALVEIAFDAFPDYRYQGSLISIDTKEITKEGDTFYRATIAFDPADALREGNVIRTGMRADLSIIASAKQNVITVPQVAVYKKEGKSYVLIMRDGTAQETEVKTGISDGDRIEIKEGVAEGAIVKIPNE